jgi:hypothetical protein
VKHSSRFRVWSAAPSAFTGSRFPADVIGVVVRVIAAGLAVRHVTARR